MKYLSVRADRQPPHVGPPDRLGGRRPDERRAVRGTCRRDCEEHEDASLLVLPSVEPPEVCLEAPHPAIGSEACPAAGDAPELPDAESMVFDKTMESLDEEVARSPERLALKVALVSQSELAIARDSARLDAQADPLAAYAAGDADLNPHDHELLGL
jgi:hypothetical protein